jgi:phosphomethylpyrimidine synthase
MCGHDWCSMRISKEIQEFASGKDPSYQPERRAAKSPGVGTQGRELLEQRAHALPVVDGKHACHSEVTPVRDEAEDLQRA